MGEEKTPEDSSISQVFQKSYVENIRKIVRVSKAWKFVISKHEIFSATNFDLKTVFSTNR